MLPDSQSNKANQIFKFTQLNCCLALQTSENQMKDAQILKSHFPLQPVNHAKEIHHFLFQNYYPGLFGDIYLGYPCPE